MPKELTKDDILRLKMVKRLDENFDKTNENDLFNKLDKRYPNRGTLSVICYSLKKAFALDEDDTKAEYWANKGAELTKEVNKQEYKNELVGDNEKKKWKTQKEVLEIMEKIKTNMKNRTDMNRFILLSLMTYQPPLRKDFYLNLKFLFDIKKNNKKDNYLYLVKKPINKAFFIVNNDKVSKYTETFDKDENKVIEITNKDLISMLWKNYENDKQYLKREYVFMSSDGNKYNTNTFTRVLLDPIKLNFNTLRSSYISDFYVKNPYPQERNELARQMRNSMNIAQMKYLKREDKIGERIKDEDQK